MKKKFVLIIALVLILTALTLAGCNEQGSGDPSPSPLPSTPMPEPSISVSAKQQSVSIRQKDFADFNFSSLFTISVDGVQVLIQPSYLDLSGLPQNAGESGVVVCTYKGVSATCTVSITPVERKVELSTQEISITQLQLDDGVDFLAFFSIYQDGEKMPITQDMVNNQVKREVGDYSYSVTYGNDTMVLTVHVLEAHRLEVVNTYRLLEIEQANLSSLDLTSLFSLYVDGKTQSVTLDMIDASALDGATTGQTCEIKFSYTYRNASINKSAYVKIVEPKSVVITAKNVVTYPNSAPIDVTSLFTITDGDDNVQVTIDMISGNIDYTAAGINEITLTYKGITRVAQIEVKKGVVINKIGGDTVIVQKGTNKNEYNFANDIQLIVNGLEFSFVTYGEGAKFHIDTTGVDFNTLGTYTATVAIPYGAGANKTVVNDTITYVVKDKTYEASLINEEIVLAKGTTSYNVLQNIDVKVNGIKRTLTENIDIAQTDVLAVWAKVLNGVDFTSIAAQKIKIAIYPEGVDTTPVLFEYSLQIKSNVVITSTGKIAFGGDTVYTKDLFSISDDGKNVAVTTDMLEGKVDTSKPGVYPITITYLGLQSVANVVVLSENIVGIYKTNMTTIPSAVTTDTSTDITEDDWNSGYGDSSDSYDDDEVKPVYPLANMSILRDGSITINGVKATVKDAVDENTIIVEMNRANFTLHFYDGIVVVNPDNSLRMTFHDAKRPMVYFIANVWDLKSRVVVNSGSNYVLSTTNSGYSFDVFKAERKDDKSSIWFALYVRLVTSMSSDTIYDVSWGNASIPSDFTPKAGAKSTLTYNGNTYDFEMSTTLTARVVEKQAQLKYANMTFKGSADGSSDAKLYVGAKESFKLMIGSKVIFDASQNDVNYMTNGGVDYDNDVVFLYKYTDGKFYSYKFRLNTQNSTFECIEKDSLYGLYEYGKGELIFLDGYGTGFAKFKKSTDGTSYSESKLTYEIIANELVVKFVSSPYDFVWGDSATFYLATFGNVLTVKQMARFENVDFVNTHITDGAIVTVGQTVFKNGSKWETEFFNALKIITKDGEMALSAKKNCTDKSKVAYGTAGFYNVSITLPYAAQSVTADYAVQIISAISGFSATNWVFDFGSGALNSSLNLSVESTGMVTLNTGDALYKGYANLSNDTLYAHLDVNNGSVDINGKYVSDGLLFVRGTGVVGFNEYFTKGTKSVVAGTGATIRKFTYNGSDVYFFATSQNSAMQVLENYTVIEGTDMQNGSIISFATDKKEYIVKIIEWGNAVDGLKVSDKYRGIYAKSGADNLVIDGFGALLIGSEAGTYTINQNGSLLVYMDDSAFVLDIDLANMSYADSKIKLDASLVVGKSFVASYNFICYDSEDDSSYSGLFKAETIFEFLSDGKVRIVSTSSEHDSGEDSCTVDVYAPPFASASGYMGTYSVNGKIVSVSVGSYTFTFEIDDVSIVSALKCIETSVEDTAHGYFSKGTEFFVK